MLKAAKILAVLAAIECFGNVFLAAVRNENRSEYDCGFSFSDSNHGCKSGPV